MQCSIPTRNNKIKQHKATKEFLTCKVSLANMLSFKGCYLLSLAQLLLLQWDQKVFPFQISKVRKNLSSLLTKRLLSGGSQSKIQDRGITTWQGKETSRMYTTIFPDFFRQSHARCKVQMDSKLLGRLLLDQIQILQPMRFF